MRTNWFESQEEVGFDEEEFEATEEETGETSYKLSEFNTEIIQSLVGIGLSHSEAKVYLALVRRGKLTAVDACKISGVPRAKIYELLNNLSTYGLCYETPGKKKSYTVVNPQESLKRRLASARKELELQESLTLVVRDQLMPLFNSIDQVSGSLFSPVHFLSNTRLTASVYLKLLNEAQKEILFLSKPPYNVSVRASQPAVHAAVKRGVNVRVLCEMAECENKEALGLLLENQSKGVKLAVVDKFPVKLIVGDDKVALLILSDTTVESSGLALPGSSSSEQFVFNGMLIEHEQTVALLKISFEHLWQQSIPLEVVAAQIMADTKSL